MQETAQTSIKYINSPLIALEGINDHFIALGLLIFCIVSRFVAIPASLWEWDDHLFASALHFFDLQAQSPHPPGFPLFVAMTRALYWVIGDEYRALTIIAFIFASFVSPALFYLYRAIKLERSIAFAGALLGSFAPNVWVHSGAGRSDGVAFTLGIIGLILVIRGVQSGLSLIAGCVVFGLGLGVRTTLLPVMGPVIALIFLRRLWRGQWSVVITSAMVGILCVLIWYLPMIYHVGWPTYRLVMNNHSQYIIANDSILSYAETPLLLYRLRRFFADLWGAVWIMQTIYTLSALGLIVLAVKRQWHIIGWMVVIFLPYLIFTFLLNAPLGGPLYALPYVPLFTGLTACSLVMMPRMINCFGEGRALKNLGLFLSICLTITIALWTYPAIKLLHREVSPPVRAFNYLQKTLDPNNDLLYYDTVFIPHVRFYLPKYKTVEREKNLDPQANLIWSLNDRPRLFMLTSDPILGLEGQHYYWTARDLAARRLGRISLERYFGAHIAEIAKPRGIEFLSGWYEVEIDHRNIWRWMGRKGKVALSRLAESMILHLRGSIEDPPNPDRRPTLILRMNGTEVDRISLSGSEVDHKLMIKPDPSLMWSILSLEIDQTVIPKSKSTTSTREYGLKIFSLDWSPAPGAPLIQNSPNQYLTSGWCELENSRNMYWRWINGSSIAHLPAIAGDGRLDLKMNAPQQYDGIQPEIKIEAGGKVIDKFQALNGYFTKTYYLPQLLHHSAKLELKISLPNAESNPPVLQIYYLGWRPSEKN